MDKNIKNILALVKHQGFLFQLENLGLITKLDSNRKISLNNYKLTSAGEQIVPQVEEMSLEDLVSEYRKRFPKGVKSGGYYVAGDQQACLRKMKKFLKDYDYEHKTILKATEQYLDRMRDQDYKYTQLSHFFIYKNGISNLSTECENLMTKDKDKEGTSLTL